ncbi:MAG TPA: hypothetical protein VNU97_14240 [Rhizomicrobium sp.]|jgi:hypothetical protein|nr:hypothetical protein [Rhizomicrobium sp.]
MHPATVALTLIALTLAFCAAAPLFSPPLRLRETSQSFPGQQKYWLRHPADGDARRGLFTVGTRYRIKADLVQRHARFADGEVLTFRRADYSRFDHAYVYCFQHADGRVADWWLSDCEPVEKSQAYFEALV